MRFVVSTFAIILVAFTSHPAVAADDVKVCGQLNAYQKATSTQNAILSLRTSAGFVDYQLVLKGTVPADLGQDPALPEILRLTGRSVQGVNTVADYTVVRVSSCSLPSTTTAAATEGLSWPIAIALVVAFVLAGTIIRRANGRKAAV